MHKQPIFKYTYNFDDYFQDLALNQTIASTYSTLTQLATGDRFDSIFESAFGSKFERAVVTKIQNAWAESDFSQLPSIEILDSSTMPQSNGAYAAETNRIYLNADFVSQANREDLKAVVIEEIGHWLDSQINTEDSQGDEGELFSALVRGQELSEPELDRIAKENDSNILNLQGQKSASLPLRLKGCSS